MTRLDPQVKAVLVARLRERRAAGELTSAQVRQAAAEVGVGERTLWGWLAADPAQLSGRPRARYEITEADRDAYAKRNGNVAAVHRELHAGTGGPSVRWLQKAFARDLSPAERAAARDGVEGRRRHEVYLRWAPNRRNALWEGDHVELPVLVLAPRAHRARKPWATLFIDAFSRLIMGWALSLYPSSATVLATLRSGIVADPERGPWHGLPEAVRPDNGMEFAAAAIRRSCAALGIEHRPTPAYQGYSKGKVERVNRTLEQEFLSGLPFYTHGPRAADGQLFGPDADPMSLELFVSRFDDWVRDYNTGRVHSELGETPLARWCSDATPLREVAAEQLRWMLMADTERTINKDGVHFERARFMAPELNGLVGERVQVRYTPHDLRSIEIFRGDSWLATAYPQDTLTDEQKQAVLERRRADAAELGRRRRRASRRSRAQLAPITKPGELEDTTVVTTDTERADRAGRRAASEQATDSRHADEALRRLARTNLLDLKTDFAFWNPGLAAPADLDQVTDTPPEPPPAVSPPETADPDGPDRE